jgi:hypothetical protein
MNMSKPVDIKAMRDRISERARNGKPGAKNPYARWTRDILTLSSMDKVLEWCKQKKIGVFHAPQGGQGGTWEVEDRAIFLEPRSSIRQQLFTLLHECGHALIDESTSRVSSVRFGEGYLPVGRKTTRVDKVNLISVELEAWNRGWLLAERLGIPVPRDEFDRAKANAIMSYMKWVLSPKSNVI